jgi:hypothetical protein
MFDLCPPALIYVVFSITQIIIDTFKGLYNTAFFKFIVMCMVTLLLNALCQSGMGVISWIIVFIPFILMTVIVTMLLYIFGLDAASGSINYNCQNGSQGNASTKATSTITYAPTTSDKKIIIVDTNPSISTNTQPQSTQPLNSDPFVHNQATAPTYSSSPEYESFSNFVK